MVHELVSRITQSVSTITENFEIILVNDASPDASWLAIQAECAADKRVMSSKSFYVLFSYLHRLADELEEYLEKMN